MKSITNRIFLFAAAALSLGTVAYGQTTLKADVPFAFRLPGGATTAGHYSVQIEENGNGPIARMRDRVTGRSVASIAIRLENKAGAAIAPRLVFRCAEAGCQLSEIWTVTGGFALPVKHLREPEYVASIPLVAAGD